MKVLGLLSLLVLILAGLFAWQQYPQWFGTKSFGELADQIQKTTDTVVGEIQKEISTPPPLRRSMEGEAGTLTVQGILSETNRHRANEGLPALKLNAKLSAAASAKTNDMFTQQYFEHVGPDGRGPSDWVEDAGYDYLRVGENLALGNFKSDADLVQAWMDSPGHRANILSSGFTEIGLAAKRGQFENHSTYLAVQEFGLPASACPTPDTSTRTKIDQKQAEQAAIQAELDSTKNTLETLAAEIERLSSEGNAKIQEGNEEIKRGNEIYQETGDKEQAQPHWDRGEQLQQEGEALHEQAREKQAEYERRQATYNNFVRQFNELGEEIKSLVDQLNSSIRTYNTCAENFG